MAKYDIYGWIKRKKGISKIQKKSEMTRVSNHLSVIILNLNELNSPIQSLDIGLTKFLKTWSNYRHCLQETPFRSTDTIGQKWKNETFHSWNEMNHFISWNISNILEMKWISFMKWNIFHANSKEKRPEMALIYQRKQILSQKKLRDKQEYHILIKWSIHK